MNFQRAVSSVLTDCLSRGVHPSFDSAANGEGEVREPRMYQLIGQRGAIKDATFEIEFLDAGVEAFSFGCGYFGTTAQAGYSRRWSCSMWNCQ